MIILRRFFMVFLLVYIILSLYGLLMNIDLINIYHALYQNIFGKLCACALSNKMESRIHLLRRSVGSLRQCKRWMGLVTKSWGKSYL